MEPHRGDPLKPYDSSLAIIAFYEGWALLLDDSRITRMDDVMTVQ